jgi:hypothetical protein
MSDLVELHAGRNLVRLCTRKRGRVHPTAFYVESEGSYRRYNRAEFASKRVKREGFKASGVAC